MLRKSLIVVALGVATFGCGDSPTAPTEGGASAGSPGTLNVRITDSPYSKAKAVLITFSEVNANGTRLPFSDPSASTWTCDLKKLQNGASDLLATARPSAREYTEIKLVVQSAKIFNDNSAVSPTPCARSIPEPAGASFPMSISASQATVNGSFSLRPDSSITILVDFDGESSISQSGATYVMNPVLRLVSVQ